MTDDEKVRIVAEWCGLCIGKSHRMKREEFSISEWECDVCRRPLRVVSNGHLCDPRTKFDSLNACAEFERVAASRGCGEDYYSALWDSIHPKLSIWGVTCDPELSATDNLAYLLAVHMATPAQRVEAILAVIEETRP